MLFPRRGLCRACYAFRIMKKNTAELVVDYCIVGAGPAGCVLANRLSANGLNRVLLLEAGSRDWHPYIHIPAAGLTLYNDARFNWLYHSAAEPGLNGRVLTVSQGKVLGGSSSINGMLHVRGQPEDFDGWREAGCAGWGYADMLPYFRKAEDYLGHAGQDGRGHGGLHPVSDFTDVHPLTQAFLEGAREQGSRINLDLNGPVREGAALYQQNRKGRFRSQPAQTYLRQAKQRQNLEVLTGAHCTGVTFEGTTATGVTYQKAGRAYSVQARKEVILSAGTVRTPQLLLLSGIGSPAELARHGIPVVAPLEGVGQNLKDHFMVRIAQRLRGIQTLNERARGPNLLWNALPYLFAAKGLLTMGAGTAVDIFRSRPDSVVADGLLLFAPGSYVRAGVLEDHPGMTAGCWPSHPESSGAVTLTSRHSADAPEIRFNYLDAEKDRATVLAGIRRGRAIFASKAFAKWNVAETKPGSEAQSDDELLDFARQEGTSGYHLVGTARMGADRNAVVDHSLRVRGVTRLRVMDASVLPNCTVANPNATIVAMAERAADLILGKAS